MTTMKKKRINPWDWQNEYGFSQAWRVDEPDSVIEVSGQTSVDGEGQIQCEGDFAGQVRCTFENLSTVLQSAGGSLDDVVKLGAYVTDEQNVEAFTRIQQEFLPDDSPSQTLLVVKSLALPELMVEVEATAFLS